MEVYTYISSRCTLAHAGRGADTAAADDGTGSIVQSGYGAVGAGAAPGASSATASPSGARRCAGFFRWTTP